MSKVYLAGPITGLSYASATSWREFAEEYLASRGLVGLSPMRAKNYLSETVKFPMAYGEGGNPLSTDKGITTRDRNDVLNCDLVLANFLGADHASCGTAIEFGWADAWRVPVIMVIEPEGNPFDHGMMRSIAGFRVETLETGLELAVAILGGAA